MKLIRFTSDDSDRLKQAFEIRDAVFIQEQKVDFQEEFDPYDKDSIHYLVYLDSVPVGTARWRITNAGVKLERFAVVRDARKKGVGDLLLREMLKEVSDHHSTYLHAQVDVIPFYEKHGFVKVGGMFEECNIRHFKMIYDGTKAGRGLSLEKTIDFVREFHQAFGLHQTDVPTVQVDPSLIALRHRLMQEENEEYFDAAKSGDLVEVADALGDMLYILCGTIITHGMQHKIAEVYEEIQRSNMSKLDKNGQPIYREDGKVMKSDLYFKPDIKTILEKS